MRTLLILCLFLLAACSDTTGPSQPPADAPTFMRYGCEIPGHNSGSKCAIRLGAATAATAAMVAACRISPVACGSATAAMADAWARWRDERDSYGHQNTDDAWGRHNPFREEENRDLWWSRGALP